MNEKRQKRLRILLWAAQIALAATFISIGLMRLAGSSSAVETFEQIGLGQWLRYLTGALELAGGVGLLIPRLAGAAALGLTGVMVGATVANFVVLTPAMAALTILLGITSAVIARARWADTKSLVRQLRGRYVNRLITRVNR